jgi:hypothetical protein
MSLAAKLPYDHPYAGGYPGIGSQPLPADADALDYLSRVKAADGAGVEVGVATAVNAFFADAKELGVFSALKACCILAGARTLAGALVPVVGDAPTNVANGFVNGDFSRTSGLTGDGTSYLDSGQAIDGPANYHQCAYITAKPTVNTVFVGSDNASQQRYLLYSNVAADETRAISGQTGTPYLGGSGSLEAGFKGVSRASANDFEARASATTSSVSSAAGDATSLNSFVFGNNLNETLSGAGDATLAFYSIGTSLSLEDMDTAVTNLINRLKFALLVGENPSGLDTDTIDYIVRGYEAGGSLV